MRYTKLLGIIVSFLLFIVIFEMIFIDLQRLDNKRAIMTFAKVSQSYNLALSNETIAIRDRYESDIADIFGLSPTSREYFHSTFVYNIKAH